MIKRKKEWMNQDGRIDSRISVSRDGVFFTWKYFLKPSRIPAMHSGIPNIRS